MTLPTFLEHNGNNGRKGPLHKKCKHIIVVVVIHVVRSYNIYTLKNVMD